MKFKHFFQHKKSAGGLYTNIRPFISCGLFFLEGHWWSVAIAQNPRMSHKTPSHWSTRVWPINFGHTLHKIVVCVCSIDNYNCVPLTYTKYLNFFSVVLRPIRLYTAIVSRSLEDKAWLCKLMAEVDVSSGRQTPPRHKPHGSS